LTKLFVGIYRYTTWRKTPAWPLVHLYCQEYLYLLVGKSKQYLGYGNYYLTNCLKIAN